MDIQWFPGHMSKTRRELKESLKLVDVVIEIRDARIVKSSANPEIDVLCKDKPRLILLNKSDLSDAHTTREWIKYLTKSDILAIEVNSLTGEGLKSIKGSIDLLLKEKLERMKNKGLKNFTIRAMVVGIPNVGKSSFINKMAKNNIAKTGDRPGVTKSKQWIKTKVGLELMDTPGILWPKFEDAEVALNLAFTGAIKDEIMNIEELAVKLIERISNHHGESLKQRYKLESINEDYAETLSDIARKRGAILPGGHIDYNRVAVMLLDEFRGGKLGKISLEKPEE